MTDDRGAPRVRANCRPEYTPSEEWGPECFVQWGDRGVVISDNAPPRGTAFFEAFPKSGSGFIRGEGETVAEAEDAALGKRRRELACDGHRWGRRGYTNGLCFCTRCGATSSNVMKPIVRLGEFRNPVSSLTIQILLETEDDWDRQYLEKNDQWLTLDRKDMLRLRLAGIAIPDRGDMSAQDFHDACRTAAAEWALTEKADAFLHRQAEMESDPTPGAMSRVFSSLGNRIVEQAIAEIRAKETGRDDLTP